MKMIQFASLFLILLGLFDRWGYGMNNPSPIDIALKPDYFGHSFIYTIVVTVFISFILLVVPFFIAKNNHKAALITCAVTTSLTILYIWYINTVKCGWDYNCEVGGTPSIGPLLTTMGLLMLTSFFLLQSRRTAKK